MALVFAALVPHTPLLTPAIGKKHRRELGKTIAATARLVEELYAAQPDCVVILSPHAATMPGSLSVNVADPFLASLKAFGDLTDPTLWRSHPAFAQRLKERCEGHHLPLLLRTDPLLDYGTVVPLTFLRPSLPTVRLVPTATTDLDARTHYSFGTMLREEILGTGQRVAVLASGHLSELVPDDAAAAPDPRALAFDTELLALLDARAHDAFIGQPNATALRSCAFLPLAVLLGVLHDAHYRTDVRSLERPFGTPYAVVALDLT